MRELALKAAEKAFIKRIKRIYDNTDEDSDSKRRANALELLDAIHAKMISAIDAQWPPNSHS
jgi:hypothetical protein